MGYTQECVGELQARGLVFLGIAAEVACDLQPGFVKGLSDDLQASGPSTMPPMSSRAFIIRRQGARRSGPSQRLRYRRA